MNIRKISVALLSVFAVYTSLINCNTALVLAQGVGGQQGSMGPILPGMLGVFPSLSLSQDQIAQLQSILTAAKTSFDGDRAALDTAKKSLFDFLKAGGNDSAQIQTFVSAISAAEATLRVDEANVFVSAYSVLTDTQKETLAALTAPQPPPPPGMQPAPTTGGTTAEGSGKNTSSSKKSKSSSKKSSSKSTKKK